MLAIPASIALHSIRTPAILHVEANASPHGYTWSLLLFTVPIVAIAIWFLPSEGLEIPQRAFWRTIAILAPIGCLLDVVFAQWFFEFPNPQSTLGISAPALGKPVPVEEYVFYLTGFIAVLLLYVWFSEYWLAAYSVDDERGEARALPRLLRFHPTSLIFGVLLIAAAIVYKKAVLNGSRRLAGILHRSRRWRPYSRNQLFPGHSPLHQLACSQPDHVLHHAGEPGVGSNVGSAIRLVELSASVDDWDFHRCMVRPACRSSAGLARSNLWHRSHVRGGQNLAGFGTPGEGNPSRLEFVGNFHVFQAEPIALF